MVLFFRIFFLSLFLLFLASSNQGTAPFSIFGWRQITLPMSFIILFCALVGFLICRWYEDFKQISLIKVIQEYSKKVTALEKELDLRRKEPPPPHPN